MHQDTRRISSEVTQSSTPKCILPDPLINRKVDFESLIIGIMEAHKASFRMSNLKGNLNLIIDIFNNKSLGSSWEIDNKLIQHPNNNRGKEEITRANNNRVAMSNK